MYVCMYDDWCMYVHVCMYACMYVYMYVCMYVCMYDSSIYMYTSKVLTLEVYSFDNGLASEELSSALHVLLFIN